MTAGTSPFLHQSPHDLAVSVVSLQRILPSGVHLNLLSYQRPLSMGVYEKYEMTALTAPFLPNPSMTGQ